MFSQASVHLSAEGGDTYAWSNVYSGMGVYACYQVPSIGWVCQVLGPFCRVGMPATRSLWGSIPGGRYTRRQGVYQWAGIPGSEYTRVGIPEG